MLSATTIERIEHDIRTHHPEDYPGETVTHVEWVGEIERAGELMNFFRVDTTGGSYRYYTDETHALRDVEGEWS